MFNDATTEIHFIPSYTHNSFRFKNTKNIFKERVKLNFNYLIRILDSMLYILLCISISISFTKELD